MNRRDEKIIVIRVRLLIRQKEPDIFILLSEISDSDQEISDLDLLSECERGWKDSDPGCKWPYEEE